jgi:Cu(I)/Ag(I) efflux system membrane fusion protein/cobalt-zinc-cadmium efflux system membrane fusion protein
MNLVPIDAPALDDAASGPNGREETESIIAIDPVIVQNTGVVSELAMRETIARRSRTVGILDFDADRISWVNTKFEGWIEKVHVSYVGQRVEAGEPLFEIYSPELVTTQEEYLRALEYRSSLERSGRAETRRQADRLLRSTRERLVHWEVSQEQIRSLEETGRVQRLVTVNSPASGVIVEVAQQALEGMHVKPGADLYKIADLASVWVHAEVFEADLAWIREGQAARVSFRHDPERETEGRILFLYPELAPETRTLKICVALPNPDGRLRPGMYADVVLSGPPVRDAVVIPDSAVLRSGERNLVFVDLGEGRFAPREIELGIEGEHGRVQVLRGLHPGEAVVTQAQFMLDSESRIREAIAKFTDRASSVDFGHEH